jgi:hypothetical protein
MNLLVLSQDQMKGAITMHSNREGIPILFQAGAYSSRQIEWGNMDAGFWTFPAGFDSTPLFPGLAYGCECPHWGYLLKGRMRVRYADHEEVITAGEAYYLAPGHLPVMEEDCEMVEFSPSEQSRRMLQYASRSIASK